MLEIEVFANRKIVWTKDNLLSPSECQEIRQDMLLQKPRPSLTYNEDIGPHISHDRKTYEHLVSSFSRNKITEKLNECFNEIQAFFQIQVSSTEELQFLRYPVGYYFKPHQDALPEQAKLPRLLTFIVFLNNQSLTPVTEDSEEFSGGSLVFYGGGKSTAPNKVGLPMRARQGSIIAFDPYLVHEVRPVESGCRFTAISWLK